MTIKELSEQVIAQANIIDIIGEIVELKATKGGHWGLCPFHDDKHASMSVINRDKQKMYNCFSCGEKGNVINFYSKYYGISYSQATIKLAEKLGIPVDNVINSDYNKNDFLYKIMKEASDFYSFYLKNALESNNAVNYLYNRGLTDEIIDEFKIGLAPNELDNLHQSLNREKISELDQIELGLVNLGQNNKPYDVFRNRIMFPIMDEFGRVIAFSGRIYENNLKEAKYINSKENPIFHKGNTLYHLDIANKNLKGNNPIYIMEGFMDVIAASISGVKTAVASMGTALTENHVRKILSLTNNIVLCFDGDSAGIKALQKSLKIFSALNIIPNALIIEDGMDPDEYRIKFGNDKLKNLLETKYSNATDVIYNFELQKVDKTNILTIERFKNEIFTTLEVLNQASIVDHYLHKLEADLNIDFDLIRSDYQKFKKTYSARVVEEKQYQSENIPIKTLEKRTIIKKKHEKAWMQLIILMLKDKQFYLKFLNDGNEDLFLINAKSLRIYESIYYAISQYYNTPINNQYPSYINDEIDLIYSDKEAIDYKKLQEIISSVEYKTIDVKQNAEKAYQDNIAVLKELEKNLIYEETKNKNSIDDSIASTQANFDLKSKNIAFIKEKGGR